MIAPIVYSLCAVTALGSAVLLLRGYLNSRARLLLWSSLCFFGLAANNLVLFFDLVVMRNVDLHPLRLAFALGAMLVLLYGLIWESDK